jgi:hypothetical protein
VLAGLKENDSLITEDIPERRNSQRLAQAAEDVVDLTAECEREAGQRALALYTRYGRIAFRDPQATRMGDARFLTESYSLNVYNVDFSYIWPRLQLVLPEQGGQGQVGSHNDRLIAARAQVDFAVLSLALALTIPLLWLPLLAWHGESVPLFIAIGVGGPLLAMFFYQLAVASQFDFGEVVKAAIDKYRFDVLANLRQALPATLAAERALWNDLRVAERKGSISDLFYRHKAPS